MYKVIGRCSECGGQVEVPEVWMGIYPPIPECRSCGAKASNDVLPVIRMAPKKKD